MKRFYWSTFFLCLFSAHANEADLCASTPEEALPKINQDVAKLAMTPPLVNIISTKLKKNPKAFGCKRNTDDIDTIVIHHSETGTKVSAKEINSYHLERGTSKDPWLMIGYHYVINSPYSNQTFPTTVSAGRPVDLVGAHLGSESYVKASDEIVDHLKKNPIKCTRENGSSKLADDTFDGKNNVKANVTTVGIVIVGNYAPYSRYNRGGYPVSQPRIPTKEMIETTAKLSCELQRQYPKLKDIKWHSYYKATSCPGIIQNYIDQIKTKAREYGCEF